MIIQSKPDERELAKLPLTLTMTLSVSQWREVREQMESKWPACDVRMAIYEAIDKIERALSVYHRTEQP